MSVQKKSKDDKAENTVDPVDMFATEQDPEQISDQLLIHRCLAGERDAWDVFASRYSRFISQTVFFAFKQFAEKDNIEELSKDVSQEIFLHLCEDDYRILRKYKPFRGCSFSSWLKVVARRFVIDRIRKRTLSTISIDQVGDLKDTAVPLDKQMEMKKAIEIVKTEIKKLKYEDQLIIYWVCVEGATVKQVSEITQKKLGAIYNKVSRFREKMKFLNDNLDFL